MYGVTSSSRLPVISYSTSTLEPLTYGAFFSQTVDVVENFVSSKFAYGVTPLLPLPSGLSLTELPKSFTISGTPSSKEDYSISLRSYSMTINSRRQINQANFSASGSVIVNKITATGGTNVQTIGGFRYHTFTSSSTFVISSGIDDLEIYALAGGGGGASEGNGGGGGGSGGLGYRKIIASPRTYNISPGAGGAAGSSGNSSGVWFTTGLQQQLNYIIDPQGGGRGGSFSGSAASGGSGGGGAAFTGGAGVVNGFFVISGATYTGSNGGAGGFFNGGGGGGIGAVGSNGNASPSETGGNGGNGLTVPPADWAYTSITRGGGGGGGGGSQGGNSSGGSGGGGIGRGFTTGATGDNGLAQYGAGGGGGYTTGGAGGSGIIFVRYPV